MDGIIRVYAHKNSQKVPTNRNITTTNGTTQNKIIKFINKSNNA